MTPINPDYPVGGGLFGVRVVSEPFAIERSTEHSVAAWPTRKRRKGWRVLRVEIDRPCGYFKGATLYAHPELIEQLKKASKA